MKAHRKNKIPLSVKKSYSGLGLFADENIKKKSFIIEYYGPIITTEKSLYVGGKYLFEINSKWVINGSPRYNKARYINHSCVPNCETDVKDKRVYNMQQKILKKGKSFLMTMVKNILMSI